ncbi:breast carcinoma-amplified sequence 4 [Larus michahellis]|uniref:breast carcinoma-amplified sequence 4 n=1 Tax=Larus michahellis TaxID=119627 RepID=UPI003D9B9A03
MKRSLWGELTCDICWRGDGGAAEAAGGALRDGGGGASPDGGKAAGPIRSDASEILDETILLLKDKATEMNHICGKVDKLEAFVKMVATVFPS